MGLLRTLRGRPFVFVRDVRSGLRMRPLSLALCLFASVAAAGAVKELPLDEDWASLPPGANTQSVKPVEAPPLSLPKLTPAQLEHKARTPSAMGLAAPPIGVQSLPLADANRPGVVAIGARPEPKPEDWNDVSLFGAKALKRGSFALGGYAGFPTVALRGRYGLTQRFDVGLGFESFYGMMNEAQVQGRFQFTDGDLELAAVLEGSFAHFVLQPQADLTGARWITGKRNWNVGPGVVVSRRAASPSLPRLFLTVRTLIAFDTQPFQPSPLGGVPASVQPAWNVPVRMGAEIPVSPRSSFVIDLGFDIHGRPGDSVFMPVLNVGAVVGL